MTQLFRQTYVKLLSVLIVQQKNKSKMAFVFSDHFFVTPNAGVGAAPLKDGTYEATDTRNSAGNQTHQFTVSNGGTTLSVSGVGTDVPDIVMVWGDHNGSGVPIAGDGSDDGKYSSTSGPSYNMTFLTSGPIIHVGNASQTWANPTNGLPWPQGGNDTAFSGVISSGGGAGGGDGGGGGGAAGDPFVTPMLQ